MKAFQYTFAIIAFATGLLTGCANSDDVSAPNIEFQEFIPTITLEELYEKANDTVQQYEDDDILEAYVSSSDEEGTFFKSVSLQNAEGTKGFSLSVDMYNIVNYMNPGRKVYIHLKGLYFSLEHSSLVIGDLYQETSVGRLRPQDFYKAVYPSKDVIDEDNLKQTVTLAQLKNDNFINILIEVEEVQFDNTSIGKPFFDPNGFVIGGATNHNIEDATGKMIFRTSEYANFASSIVPTESGKIRGVLTKFNTDYQFIARTFNDIQLTEDRIREEEPEEPEEPTNLLFTGADFEDWTAFNASINNFRLKNYAIQGIGTGTNGSNSLHLNGTPTANDYVFTILASAKGTIPANPEKITFWVKGTSAKSLSLNIYRATSGYDVFNVGALETNSVTLNKAEINDFGNGTNAYGGTIDTNGQWVKITLNISDVNLNTGTSGDIFALKVGSNTAYDLHIDNIEIE